MREDVIWSSVSVLLRSLFFRAHSSTVRGFKIELFDYWLVLGAKGCWVRAALIVDFEFTAL